MSAKGQLMRFVNKELRRQNKPTEGQLVHKVWLAYGVSLSRGMAWKFLAEKVREKTGVSLEPVRRKVKAIPTRKAIVLGNSDEFYASRDWQMCRFDALKKAKGCCVLCGRSHKEDGVVLHVDHIKPRSKAPHLQLDRNNLQVLCRDCNLGKGNRDDTDWR